MATSCEACYENAACLGSDSTYPIPGYIRMHNSTDLIVRCFNREACSGVAKEAFLSLDKENKERLKSLGVSTLQNCKEGY